MSDSLFHRKPDLESSTYNDADPTMSTSPARCIFHNGTRAVPVQEDSFHGTVNYSRVLEVCVYISISVEKNSSLGGENHATESGEDLDCLENMCLAPRLIA